MKRFSVLVWTMLLCSALLGKGKAEMPIDYDLSAFNRGITYAQMIQVCNAPGDYNGKVFRLKGKFNYSEAKSIARIIFSDNSGCCELAMQFIPAQELVYPEGYPALYSDIMITARLAAGLGSLDTPCWFADATIE